MTAHLTFLFPEWLILQKNVERTGNNLYWKTLTEGTHGMYLVKKQKGG